MISYLCESFLTNIFKNIDTLTLKNLLREKEQAEEFSSPPWGRLQRDVVFFLMLYSFRRHICAFSALLL